MFLLIPLLILLGSIIAISAIIWRKRFYLENSIATEGNNLDFSLSSNFSLMDYGAEFFPELSELLGRFEVSKYKDLSLVEMEKFLRKARLIFLKIDRLSDTLIKKIRKVHTNGQLKGQMTGGGSDENDSFFTAIAEDDHKKELSESKAISPNFLKNEEQRLIIEIAKNPKDYHLYEMLGDLYIEMENFTDAKESYEASVELNPQNESLKQKLSGALEKLVQK